MRFALLTAFAISAVFGAPKTDRVDLELAKNCDPELCQVPNCRCFSTDIPGGLQPSETPQVILQDNSF